MRWRFLMLTTFASVMLVITFSNAGQADTPQRDSSEAVLAKVRIDHDQWEVAVFADDGRSLPCFAVGRRVGQHYAFVGAGSCQLPTFGDSPSGKGAQKRDVLGLAFPRQIVRLQLDLGVPGKRDIGLKLLTSKQARSAHVKRFRWAFVKLIGESCLQEIIAYDAQDRVVLRAVAGADNPCNPVLECPASPDAQIGGRSDRFQGVMPPPSPVGWRCPRNGVAWRSAPAWSASSSRR